MRKLPDHHFFKHHYLFFNLKFHSLTLSKNMKKKIKNIYKISIWQWSDLECFGYLFTLKVTMKVTIVYLFFFPCRLQSKLRLSNVSYILIFSNIEIKKSPWYIGFIKEMTCTKWQKLMFRSWNMKCLDGFWIFSKIISCLKICILDIWFKVQI